MPCNYFIPGYHVRYLTVAVIHPVRISEFSTLQD
uniref:Uncharacterized protein n=1 Tax=Anguilla anguilla TaxID=7936 RepID=A0A0E9WA83_ANGAN